MLTILLEEHREQMGFQGPSGATERILVTTQYHWNGSIYVRRGQQIAKRLNGDLHVVTLRNLNKPLTKEASHFSQVHHEACGKSGGKFEELPLRNRRCIPQILVDYAIRTSCNTHCIGSFQTNQMANLVQGSVINGLLKRTDKYRCVLGC